MRNRRRVFWTALVMVTFCFMQWQCNKKASELQRRRTSTMETDRGAARPKSVLSSSASSSPPPLTNTRSLKYNETSLAQGEGQSGVRQEPSTLSSKPFVAVNSTTLPGPTLASTPAPSAVKEDSNARQPAIIMYSKAKSDRTGAAIQSMLMAHAFCWARNWTYGGACEGRNLTEIPLDVRENQQAQREMIQALGLNKELPFACPTENNNHAIIARTETYMGKGTRIFTPQWLKYIRAIVMQNGRLEQNRSRRASQPGPTMRHVAVHVRRGDINPCYPYFKARYLTNAYYLAVLDRYLPTLQKKKSWPNDLDDGPPPLNHVSIYSERENYEGWADFERRNYSMHLDTPLIDDVFYDLLSADVLITSWSALSLTAAVLNPYAQFVISPTPKWHKSMKNWVLATDEYNDMGELQVSCPEESTE